MAFYKKIITTGLLSATIVGCFSGHSTMGPVTNPAQRINFRISDFQAALAADDTTRVGEMIKSGLQCNQPIDWWYQQTPLHRAARAGAVKVVALLIEEGAAIVPQDKDGYTPLHLAARHGHVAVVEKLMESMKAMEADSALTVRDKENYMPLHRAIQGPAPSTCADSTREALVLRLLAKKIGPATIERMVRARVDEVEESAWLEWAQRLRNQWGSMPGYAAIHLAAQNGPPKAALYILAKNKEMLDNQGGRNRYTPLHLAAQSKQENIAIAKNLLKKGARYDAKDEQGCTCLHYATACPTTAEAVINTLEQRLGEVEDNFINSPDNDGRTPLHQAVIHGHLEVVERLVEQGADVRAKDHYGFTPLFLARKKCDIKEYLQSKGAWEVIPWYRTKCWGKLSYYAKNITDSLAPYLGELVPPFYLPKIINPCELVYNLCCCGFCQHQDSSHDLVDEHANDRVSPFPVQSSPPQPIAGPSTSNGQQPHDEELRRPLLNKAREGNRAPSSSPT